MAQAPAFVFQRHCRNRFQIHIQISSRSGQTRKRARLIGWNEYRTLSCDCKHNSATAYSPIGVGKAFASPPSEPYRRFSRIRLSSRQFPHRECLARQTHFRVNTSWSAKTGSVPNWSDRTRVDTVTGADTMRSRLTDASAPWSLCMLDSHKGHYQCSRLHPSFVHASTFLPCLPSARASYSRASRGLRRSGTMQALIPGRLDIDTRPLSGCD